MASQSTAGFAFSGTPGGGCEFLAVVAAQDHLGAAGRAELAVARRLELDVEDLPALLLRANPAAERAAKDVRVVAVDDEHEVEALAGLLEKVHEELRLVGRPRVAVEDRAGVAELRERRGEEVVGDAVGDEQPAIHEPRGFQAKHGVVDRHARLGPVGLDRDAIFPSSTNQSAFASQNCSGSGCRSSVFSAPRYSRKMFPVPSCVSSNSFTSTSTRGCLPRRSCPR